MLTSSSPLSARPAPRTGRRFAIPRWVILLMSDRKAAVGLFILAFFVLTSIFAPMIWTGNPMRGDWTAPPQVGPSSAHWLGTDSINNDIFLQVINGGRDTLYVGFAVAVVCTLVSVGVGLSAGYFGGWVDEVLGMITNVFLVMPGLPLCIVLASYIKSPKVITLPIFGLGNWDLPIPQWMAGEMPVVGVLSFISWAWGARVLRSQALSLRSKDFVMAAVVSGESAWRIVWFEMLPNMISLVTSSLIGTCSYAIITSVALKFLGLGSNGIVSWGTTLYYAQNGSAIENGAWWTYIPAGMCIALTVTALTLINFGVDAISNPRLRVDKMKTQPKPSAATSAKNVSIAGAS